MHCTGLFMSAARLRHTCVTRRRMAREFSAGGVVVRRLRERWMLAAIRPGGKPAGVWALPKGLVAPGEKPEDTALREVAEETGVEATSLGKLGDVRYVYTRAGERIFKIVSFYLLRYRRGRLGDKSSKYRKGMVVQVLVGVRFGVREKIFDAVIDKVEVKQLRDLSPREIEHDNPEIRRMEEMAGFLGQLYNREVSEDDTVTVIRFSQIRG